VAGFRRRTGATLGFASRLTGRDFVFAIRADAFWSESFKFFDSSAQVVDRAAVLEEFGQVAARGGVGDESQNRIEELEDLR